MVERRDGSTGVESPARGEGDEETVVLTSTRFGEIEVPVRMVLEFAEGLVGFPDHRRFVIIQHPSGGPFQWLQSAEDPDLAFVVASPAHFFVDYEVSISDEDRRALEIEDPESALILVLLVVPRDDPRGITANLQGPIVINSDTRRGRQIVLHGSHYTTRHPIFPDRAGLGAADGDAPAEEGAGEDGEPALDGAGAKGRSR